MKNKHMRIRGVGITAAVFLASCTSFEPVNSEHKISNAQNYYADNNAAFLPSLENLPTEAFSSQQARYWWESFGDPVLNQFISQSLQRSFDTRRALTNVEQAEAILRGVRADLVPSIDLNGQINATDFERFGSGTALSGVWNLDVFGRTRATVRQSQSNLANNQAIVQDVRRLTLARVSQAYIAYRTTEERIKLSQANLKRLLENKSRINRLVETGYSSRLDLNRTETQISQLQSNLAALEAQKTSTRNALAIFVQVPPKELQNILSQSASHPRILPDNIMPPNLGFIVRHRPDIRSAEWALIAATQSQHAAQLALYPDITLGGDIFSLGSAARLADIGNLSSSLFANIAQPLFGRGRLFANIDQESAIVDQALVNYEETVLQAVLDIDTALKNWARRQEQLRFDKQSFDTAKEAQQLAKKLFFAGESNYTAVIVAENTRLAAEEEYLLSRQAAFESYIAYSAAIVPNW